MDGEDFELLIGYIHMLSLVVMVVFMIVEIFVEARWVMEVGFISFIVWGFSGLISASYI